MESKAIGIKIKTMDNALHEFSVTKETPVTELKSKIAAQLNIPVNRQRIIFQGKMLKNTDIIGNYKIEEGHVLHLVANPALTDIDNSKNSTNEANNTSQNIPQNRPSDSPSLADTLSDLEILSGILRTISETSFNRRNLRRRILQQRTTGFNMNVHQSLEVVQQNARNVESLLEMRTEVSELPIQDQTYVNPFNFSERKLRIGQWIDVKDTIDQWLEAQVINVRDNQAYIHYNGWGNRWDEWIDMNSPRIALFRTYTVQSPNSRYLSPFPNNPCDGDTTHIPQQSVEFPELLEDIGRMMYKVADMTQELLNKMNPALNVSKSEKSEKHITTKQDIELQHVISGMIEEQKSQIPLEKEARSEKNVYFEDAQSVKSHKSIEKNVTFEDAQSVKSHKSLDYDAVSIKSLKSFISASDMKNINPPLNFRDYISEEDSEERSEIQNSEVNIPNQAQLRELQASLIASQLAPLYDRLGRLLVDMAPHMAILGAQTQTISTTQSNPVNPNLTVASIVTNESNQTSNQTSTRQFSFQVPVMLTPGEVIAVNNTPLTSNRIFGENNNGDLHIHAIFSQFRNLPTNPHNTSVPNTGSNTHNIGSPVMRHGNPEFRFRSDTNDNRPSSRSGDEPERKRDSSLTQRDEPEMELAPRKRDNPDEENMHEISFGTKNSETEIENIFQKLPTNNSDLDGLAATSDERIIFNHQNIPPISREEKQKSPDSSTLELKDFKRDEIVAQSQSDSIKKEHEKSPGKDPKKETAKEQSDTSDEDDESEDDEEDDDDDMDQRPGPNRSNCGRQIS